MQMQFNYQTSLQNYILLKPIVELHNMHKSTTKKLNLLKRLLQKVNVASPQNFSMI